MLENTSLDRKTIQAVESLTSKHVTNVELLDPKYSVPHFKITLCNSSKVKSASARTYHFIIVDPDIIDFNNDEKENKSNGTNLVDINHILMQIKLITKLKLHFESKVNIQNIPQLAHLLPNFVYFNQSEDSKSSSKSIRNDGPTFDSNDCILANCKVLGGYPMFSEASFVLTQLPILSRFQCLNAIQIKTKIIQFLKQLKDFYDKNINATNNEIERLKKINTWSNEYFQQKIEQSKIAITALQDYIQLAKILHQTRKTSASATTPSSSKPKKKNSIQPDLRQTSRDANTIEWTDVHASPTDTISESLDENVVSLHFTTTDSLKKLKSRSIVSMNSNNGPIQTFFRNHPMDIKLTTQHCDFIISIVSQLAQAYKRSLHKELNPELGVKNCTLIHGNLNAKCIFIEQKVNDKHGSRFKKNKSKNSSISESYHLTGISNWCNVFIGDFAFELRYMWAYFGSIDWLVAGKMNITEKFRQRCNIFGFLALIDEIKTALDQKNIELANYYVSYILDDVMKRQHIQKQFFPWLKNVFKV